MGTMEGWVTRNRLREEQERAKIEQARKEGFDDGYLAGKTFAGMEIAELRARVAEMEGLKAAVQPLGGIINALHSYRTEWASPVPDPDWQMKLRKRLFSQWDKSQPITLPEPKGDAG